MNKTPFKVVSKNTGEVFYVRFYEKSTKKEKDIFINQTKGTIVKRDSLRRRYTKFLPVA